MLQFTVLVACVGKRSSGIVLISSSFEIRKKHFSLINFKKTFEVVTTMPVGNRYDTALQTVTLSVWLRAVAS